MGTVNEKVEVVNEKTTTEIVPAQETTTSITANPYKDSNAFNQLFKKATFLAGTELVPDTYRNKPANCLIAMEIANRMNIDPITVMSGLYIVKGKPSWSGQFCSMLVQNCGLFRDVDLVYVGKQGQDDYGAFVKATRIRDGKEIHGTTVSMAMAKAEGWTSNKKWLTMTEQMLGYRAYSFFARLHCPTALNGFQTVEELEDINGNKATRDNVGNPF